LSFSESAEGSWCYPEAAWTCSIARANKEKLGAGNSGENRAKKIAISTLPTIFLLRTSYGM